MFQIWRVDCSCFLCCRGTTKSWERDIYQNSLLLSRQNSLAELQNRRSRKQEGRVFLSHRLYIGRNKRKKMDEVLVYMFLLPNDSLLFIIVM